MDPHLLAKTLETLLADFTRYYERVEASLNAQREGIRQADSQAIALAQQQHEGLARSIAQCDQRRRELVARARSAFASLAVIPGEKITLSDLARCAPEPQRNELLNGAIALRTLVSRVATESASLKSATMTLVAHMEGLIRQVGRTLSHSGVYSKRGVVEPGGLVVSAVDVRM